MNQSTAPSRASASIRSRRKLSAAAGSITSRDNPASTPAALAQLPATRLSQLPIWPLARRYFAETGMEVWRRNIVPSYVTTNPYIAGTYARLVKAFLDDCRRAGRLPSADQPVHVVELGAGSGRFAHHFLTAFHDGANQPALRYVLTDVNRANIDSWLAHEAFAPHLRAGRLDVARYDTGADREIVLQRSGTRIAPGSGAPVVVIANYVFDCIPQDAFVVEAGQLREGLATVRTDTAHGSAADRIAGLGLDYRSEPCRADYYDDPLWNALLAQHARGVGHGAFLFPSEGLACLARLRALTDGPLLMISCDHGDTRLDAFQNAGLPQPVAQGAFSFPVNYHALLEWTRQSGGLAFGPGRGHASIAVVGLAFGLAAAEAGLLDQAYDAEVRRFGPDDFFMMKKAAEETHDRLSLPQVLALLRLSRWDPAILYICYERLVALLPDAGAAERRDLHDGLALMWRQYFYIGEEQDLAFTIGSVLAGMGYRLDAIPFFEASIARHGEDSVTVQNLARCRDASVAS